MEEFFDEKTKKKAQKIIIKTGLGFIPVVGKIASAGYELKELMTGRAIEIRNKEVECKVNEFHDRLFLHTINVNENNQHSFFRDYTKILENMLRDNEAEKVQYYASMLSFFSTQKIGKDEKVFFLSTLKGLSNFEVGVLQRAIISKLFHLTTDPLPRGSSIFGPALKKIVQLGLINKEEKHSEITKAGEFLSNAIFLPQTLTPGSIGCHVFRKTKFSLLCFYDLDNSSNLKLDYIVDLIRFKLSNGYFEMPSPSLLNSKVRELDDRPLFLLNTNIVLIYDKHFSPIKHLKKLGKYNLIKIYIQTDETPDPLQDLQGVNINSYFVSPDIEKMQELINVIWKKHLSHLP